VTINAETAPSDAARDSRPQGSRWLRALRAEFAPVHLRLVIAQVLTAPMPWLAFARVRTLVFRHVAGLRIGPRSLLLGRVQLGAIDDPVSRLTIGADCVINAPLFADLTASIRIGNHVSIGHHATLITAGHSTDLPGRRGGALKPEPIVIEDGCLIGACVTVLPGVTIGAGAVVATGSLVTANVPPHKLVAGVPARVLKSLSESP